MLNEVTFLKQIRDKILLGEKKIPPDSNWGHQQATKRENTCQLSNFVNALEWACDLAIKLACSLPKSCLKPSNCEALQCCFDIAHSARWYKLVFNIYIYLLRTVNNLGPAEHLDPFKYLPTVGDGRTLSLDMELDKMILSEQINLFDQVESMIKLETQSRVWFLGVLC